MNPSKTDDRVQNGPEVSPEAARRIHRASNTLAGLVGQRGPLTGRGKDASATAISADLRTMEGRG